MSLFKKLQYDAKEWKRCPDNSSLDNTISELLVDICQNRKKIYDLADVSTDEHCTALMEETINVLGNLLKHNFAYHAQTYEQLNNIINVKCSKPDSKTVWRGDNTVCVVLNEKKSMFSKFEGGKHTHFFGSPKDPKGFSPALLRITSDCIVKSISDLENYKDETTEIKQYCKGSCIWTVCSRGRHYSFNIVFVFENTGLDHWIVPFFDKNDKNSFELLKATDTFNRVTAVRNNSRPGTLRFLGLFEEIAREYPMPDLTTSYTRSRDERNFPLVESYEILARTMVMSRDKIEIWDSSEKMIGKIFRDTLSIICNYETHPEFTSLYLPNVGLIELMNKYETKEYILRWLTQLCEITSTAKGIISLCRVIIDGQNKRILALEEEKQSVFVVPETTEDSYACVLGESRNWYDPIGITSCVPTNEFIGTKDDQELKIETNSSDSDASDECCICFENIEEKYVTIPCGHTRTCFNCLKNLRNCSICRKDIENIFKLF